MITLLEPARPRGFVSGGYRYQDEIMRRLANAGRGRQVAVGPGELDATIRHERATATMLVVDGLFVTGDDRPLPANVIALLHTVPARADWSDAPLDVIATAATTADRVRARARSVQIIRPGIDACFAPPATPPENARLRVVSVGTLCEAKGQHLLAAAAASAPAGACEVVFIGDAARAPEYVASVRAAAGATPTIFRGCIAPDMVAAELQSADLLVSTSDSESHGMAVAEACACGTPVLAFDVGEIRDCVREGANGWLLRAGDEAALTRRLLSLLADRRQLRHARRRDPVAVRTWGEAADEFARACAATSTALP